MHKMSLGPADNFLPGFQIASGVPGKGLIMRSRYDRQI